MVRDCGREDWIRGVGGRYIGCVSLETSYLSWAADAVMELLRTDGAVRHKAASTKFEGFSNFM
jgi:hypothetical protein